MLQTSFLFNSYIIYNTEKATRQHEQSFEACHEVRKVNSWIQANNEGCP
jgi:hypothetical protein